MSALNEDKFNLEIRKFLKIVGITSQREIEQAVRAAVESGKLGAGASVAAKVTLELPELGVQKVISEQLDLS
jgi:hypothetical protein